MLARLFLEHPRSVDESYVEHLVFAAGFALKLMAAALAALIHAILPFLFERTASRIVADLFHRTQGRGR